MVPRDRLLRLPQVIETTGCQKSTIYSLMKKGEFPKNIAVTRRMAAWPETAVLQWIQDHINGGAQ
jgi:prophage regulatory protein